jgi:hypothetical protein
MPNITVKQLREHLATLPDGAIMMAYVSGERSCRLVVTLPVINQRPVDYQDCAIVQLSDPVG